MRCFLVLLHAQFTVTAVTGVRAVVGQDWQRTQQAKQADAHPAQVGGWSHAGIWFLQWVPDMYNDCMIDC
jgi:hypothetical protein